MLLILLVLPAFCDDQPQPQPNESQKIISFLNQSIVWYRQFTSLERMATDPSDVLFFNDNRAIDGDIVRLSFDFARARSQAIISENPAQSASSQPSTNRYQRLLELSKKTDQQLKQAQERVASIRKRLETATGKKRTELAAVLSETESEAELIQARRDVLKNMTMFLSSSTTNGLGAGTLQSQIEELARTTPVAQPASEAKDGTQARPSNTASTAALSVANTRKAEPTGIFGLVSDLIALNRKLQAIRDMSARTDELADASKAIRTPLIKDLRDLITTSDQIAAAPESSDPAVLAQQKKQIDALTAQYKQMSAAVLPLGKQSVLLDVFKRTLSNWHNSVEDQYRAELKSLIVRLVILGILIGLIAAVSEVWRKATFRYVHDIRRRYQFLVLRRIVVWVVIAIVVASAFAAELGTLATFAGLLTAGIAVALQNVILSVAGYFFLIGKYGVRVGDRIQIAGVTGDVIDIGIVRLHLMEVHNAGADARPTGRVVVFSNAVVFQPNAGLFKQIPGTSFVWHEITLTLAAESNYQLVEKAMMEAVESVYADYKAEMEAQRHKMEQSLSPLSVKSLVPESRLRLTQSGLEVVIRYPVDLNNAAAIDDRMARALLDAIAKEPRLRLVGSGTPNIQAVPEQTPA